MSYRVLQRVLEVVYCSAVFGVLEYSIVYSVLQYRKLSPCLLRLVKQHHKIVSTGESARVQYPEGFNARLLASSCTSSHKEQSPSVHTLKNCETRIFSRTPHIKEPHPPKMLPILPSLSPPPLLTTRAFCLQLELFCLQLELISYSRKVRLVGTETDCKPQSSTVSKRAPSASNTASQK